jgi:hypothetical protein
MVLTLRREIAVDLQAAKEASGLGTESRLGIVVSAFSTASWVRNEVFRKTLNPEDSRLTAQFELHGEEFGGNLRLRTALVLDDAATTAPFVAHIPGSILWSDSFEIRLQGDAPQFPISVVDFERAGFPLGAGWYLHVESELDAPLHASLRLYVNSSSSAVVAAFQNAAAPRPEDRAILQAVRADVARVLVEHSLNQDELRSPGDWDSESLGFALRALLVRFYRGEDLEQVGLRRLHHPADFTAELLGQLRVFDGD